MSENNSLPGLNDINPLDLIKCMNEPIILTPGEIQAIIDENSISNFHTSIASYAIAAILAAELVIGTVYLVRLPVRLFRSLPRFFT
jgi:hypothetical protein